MLNQWLSIPSLLVLVPLLAGCGAFEKKNKEQSDDVLPPTVMPQGDIRWLTAEDPSCIKTGKSVSLTSATIYEWNGSQTVPKIVQFSGRPGSSNEFTSNNIIGSILNLTRDYKCTQSEAGEVKCVSQTRKETTYDELKICRTNGIYGRDSLEGMTLTAQYYTETAYDFYNSIPGKLSGLSKSILVSQPKISRQTTKANGDRTNKFDADNAGFSQTDSTDDGTSYGLFYVYPTSKKWFDKFNNNLWEIPFVMRHEFGHHVFHHYVEKTADSVGLKLKRSDGIDSILPRSDRSRGGSLSLAASDDPAQWALDGINETFADLFGYFAGNSASGQLTGVACLNVSRDPASPVTKAGTAKGLDRSRIDIYEGRATAPKYNGDCSEPTYDDEHDMAVALGQPLGKFIETVRPSAQGKDRAQLLLIWAARIQQLVAKGTTGVSTDTLVRELIFGAKTLPADISGPCRELTPKITGLPLSTAACVR